MPFSSFILRPPVSVMAVLLTVAVAVVAAVAPVRAQEVTLQGKGLSLREVTERLRLQSGYSFYFRTDERISETRADVDLKGLSLSRALSVCADLYRCEFYSTDPRGIFAVARQPEPNTRESALGPYKLRVGPIVPNTDGPNQMDLTLILSAPDDEVVEQLAGLESGLEVKDNFGRDLLQSNARVLILNNRRRVRLNEYWLRLPLTLRDSRSVRVRTVAGKLLRYRRVKLVKFEFPLNNPARPALGQVQQELGVEARVERLIRNERGLYVSTIVRWQEKGKVVGRGLSGVPEPYLVDQQGRVHRDSELRQSQIRDGNGNLQLDQTLEFEKLPAEPVKLVYEVFVKDEPEPDLPFKLENLPLPVLAEQNRLPFYQKEGASLTLTVAGPAGERVEGEVALAFSRKDTEGWSGWHWLDCVTEPDGSLKVAHLKPGTYRLQRLFRADPAAPPLPTQQSGFVEVTLMASQVTTLPVLRLKSLPATPRGK